MTIVLSEMINITIAIENSIHGFVRRLDISEQRHCKLKIGQKKSFKMQHRQKR